ncbi:MAG: hypothetical protein KAJ10_12910 [Thermodesulfovibrionia bacterium]|nr:hypothetical protein [Thermodesulfovibrionia bacterium]
MPRNDGSEQAELTELNVLKIRKGTLEVRKLRAELNIAKGGATDAYNQTRESLRLLGECRDLFEVVMDTQLHEQIQALIKKIDTFKGD